MHFKTSQNPFEHTVLKLVICQPRQHFGITGAFSHSMIVKNAVWVGCSPAFETEPKNVPDNPPIAAVHGCL